MGRHVSLLCRCFCVSVSCFCAERYVSRQLELGECLWYTSLHLSVSLGFRQSCVIGDRVGLRRLSSLVSGIL